MMVWSNKQSTSFIGASTPLNKNAPSVPHPRTSTTSLVPPTRLSFADKSPAPTTVDSQTSPSPQTNAEFSRSSPAYPNSMIREALELVPRYDGHNLPAWRFAKICRRARETLPLLSEGYLVTLIKNKLINHAYLVVEHECLTTLDGLLDSLKRAFRSGRGSNYYRGQLNMTFMRTGEHVLDYIGRVKDLRNSIVEGDQEL